MSCRQLLVATLPFCGITREKRLTWVTASGVLTEVYGLKASADLETNSISK